MRGPIGRDFPETIDADDVVLWRRRMTDVAELVDSIGASAPELGRFLAWAAGGALGANEVAARIDARQADLERGVGCEFVMREAATGKLVGEAGVDVRGPIAEIGYWTRSDRSGHGYASAATAALTTTIFDRCPGVERVELRMDKGNARSVAVARRAGFALQGEELFATPPIGDQTGAGFVYSVTREEWRA